MHTFNNREMSFHQPSLHFSLHIGASVESSPVSSRCGSASKSTYKLLLSPGGL